MKKGDTYKGFEVIDSFDVSSYKSKAIFLRHKKTGLEVFHLLNSDKENLFAFAFRTPCNNSTGVAHIIEHSVLCGSEKFQTKDPFLQLRKQSIHTYLNAYTAKDRTVFPASSLVKSDYFTMMAVYSDAVFFPLLKKEIFLQEGWRIEKGKEGKAEIQGVVFNEMKGCYSSFNSVASDAIYNATVTGTGYENDSGGDPLKIPSLTYEEFRKFHKKYYCTANALVFLYGDIPTEEQLDFLYKNVIKRVKSPGKKVNFKTFPSDIKIRKRLDCLGPENKTKGTVALTWSIGKPAEKEDLFTFPIQVGFLSDLLLGNDSSPLSRSLLEKFPDSDISSFSGSSTSSHFFSMTIGMTNLKAEQALDFQKTVEKELRRIKDEGVSNEDIERSLSGFDFYIREIKRSSSHGPYSLVLLRRVLHSWTYGANIKDSLFYIEAFENLKKEIKENPSLINQLVNTLLLENKKRCLVTVSPSSKWSEERDRKEKNLARIIYKKNEKDILASYNKQEAKLEKEEMSEGQKEDTNENSIPSSKIETLKDMGKRIITKKTMIGSVPFYTSEETCNGIIYASILFPVDTLKPSDYKYLTLLASCIPDIGTKDKSWKEVVAEADLKTGGFGADIISANVPDIFSKKAEENPLIMGRDWLSFQFKFLEEKTEEAFAFASKIIPSISFKDKKRLKTIITSLSSSLNAGIVSSGHYYAMLRSFRLSSRSCAVQEIKDGLTSIFSINQIKKMKTEDVAKKLDAIYKKIISSGAIFHITADKKGIFLAKKEGKSLVKKLALTFPKEKRKVSDTSFFNQTELLGKTYNTEKPLADEVFIVPGNIGFAAAAIKVNEIKKTNQTNKETSSQKIKKLMADTVFAHLFETTDLWQKIRMKGGSYGVFFSVKSSVSSSCFLTYRDPKPFSSLEYLVESLPNLKSRSFSESEIEKGITGVYSGEIEPSSPSLRGATSLFRTLYGGFPSQDSKRIKSLVSLDKDDIKKAAERYSKGSVFLQKIVIIGKGSIDSLSNSSKTFHTNKNKVFHTNSSKKIFSNKIKKISRKIIKISL